MEVIQYIQGFANPFLDFFFSTITHIGGSTVGIIFSILLFWCVNKRLGYKFLYAVIFSFSLNNLIKGFFNSSRPIGQPGILSRNIATATGSSFPSGHSQASATTFTFLISQYRNIYIWIIGIFMMIMVPLSRLYLGVHWPKDVIAGTIIGIISVFISNKIFESSFDKSLSLIIYSLILFVIIGIFVPSNDLSKSLGAFIGLVVSLIIEKKFINFDPTGSFINHLIKCLIGVIGALIIYLVFSKFLPSSNFFSLLKYSLIVMWAVSISPYIFIKFKLCNKASI